MRNVPTSLRIEVAQIETNVPLELYEVDLTSIGGDVFRFHAGKNGRLQDVTWQSKVYSAYPVQVTGFEMKSSGTSSRPKMIFSNLEALLTGINNDFNDALGAVVTRRQVMEHSLDAINFPNGNPQADPTREVVRRYIIEQCDEETAEFVSYTLALPSETDGALIPARVILADICPWIYRGADCSYTGGPVADDRDQPTTDPAKDKCGKHLASCRLRFERPESLPFGGLPGANKVG